MERNELANRFVGLIKAAEDGNQPTKKHIYMNALKMLNDGATKSAILKRLNEIIEVNKEPSGDSLDRTIACENLKTSMRVEQYVDCDGETVYEGPNHEE